MTTPLKAHFNTLHPLKDEEWLAFENIIEELHFKKSDYLASEGQVTKGIYFIVEGVTRTFHLHDGKEINTAFNFAGEFVRELQSLSTGKPSKSYIQAIEDAKVAYISRNKLIELYGQFSVFETIGRHILEQMAVTEQQYASLLTSYSPEDRYKFVIENHPELLQKVPLQYLASYLGVARETLSRIRKRLV